mgnify:FL=1
MENTANKKLVKSLSKKALSKVKDFYEDHRGEILSYGVMVGMYAIGYYTGHKRCEIKASNILDTKEEVFFLDKDTNELVAKAVRTIVVRE